MWLEYLNGDFVGSHYSNKVKVCDKSYILCNSNHCIYVCNMPNVWNRRYTPVPVSTVRQNITSRHLTAFTIIMRHMFSEKPHKCYKWFLYLKHIFKGANPYSYWMCQRKHQIAVVVKHIGNEKQYCETKVART